MRRISIFSFLFAVMTVPAFGQTREPGLLPDLAAANAWQTSFQVSGRDSLKIVFHPAEWPNVSWTAPRTRPWNWSGSGILAFNATNPGPDRVVLSVRVDDDPRADEPLTGRVLDGENYNIGFVSVTDTPYPEMVRAARKALANFYSQRY